MTTNWDVMPAFHACLTSCERRFHSHTDSGFHGKGFQCEEVRENRYACVAVEEVEGIV